MNNIYTDITGEGYPLVLVHGYFGSSNMWCHQKKNFSKHFKVIAPSLPGYGESYRLKSLSNIKDMAEAVIKITKENNISKFHLMGHSMGGMIVQEIVKISPKIVDKLILFGTGSIGDIPGRFEPIDVSRERLKKDGVKSTAIKFNKNIKKFLTICFAISFVLLVTSNALILSKINIILILYLIPIGLLIYQIQSIDPKNNRKNLSLFKLNNYYGLSIFVIQILTFRYA